MSQESYSVVTNRRNSIEDSLDNNDPSVDDDRHSTSTLTTTLYSYQQDHTDMMDTITDNLESQMNNTILDVETGTAVSPHISSITGIIEQIFTSGVLLYLTAKDLCRLSAVSRYFNIATNKTYIWKRLLKIDFMTYNDGDNRDDNSSYHSIITMASTYPTPAKLLYVRRYKEAKRLIDIRRHDHRTWMKTIKTTRLKNIISRILDLTQFRLLIPLPSLCLFLSMLLFALRLDHKISIPVWSCGVPLFVFFGYVVICFLVTLFLFSKRYNSSSLFQQHFYQLRSPFIMLFNDDFSGYKRIIGLFLSILVLLIVQLALICAKLDASYGNPSSDNLMKKMSWNIVFIPFWLLFGVYALIPAMKILSDLNGFVAGLLLFWMPLFILIVSLGSKLTNDPDNHIRMSLILLPFWLIEGSVMFSSIAYLSVAIKRFRLGATESFNETIGVIVTSWTILSPFVVFQTLLCVKDDDYRKVSHSDVVTPMLIVLGTVFVVCVISVISLKTPFEVTTTIVLVFID